MLFVIENGLVQVRDRPAFWDVELEEFRQLFVSFMRIGIAPGAERNKELTVLIEGEVAMHHGGEAHACNTSELNIVCFMHAGN